MSGLSTVWEDTDGCTKQYMCSLSVYLMNLLSSSYGIITDLAINAPGHGKNVVNRLNATDKRYFKGKMELVVKLASNNSTNFEVILSASKDVSFKSVDQCLHILNNKEIFNGLKGTTNIQISIKFIQCSK